MSVDWQAARRALARRLLRAPSGTGSTAIDPAAIQRVLVARPNHRLGNVLLLTPLLQELEQWLPHAQVDVLAGPPFAACLLQGYSGVARVDTMSARPLHHPHALWSLWRELPGRGYALALDAAERSQSARWAVGRSRATWRVGIADADHGSGGLTHAVPNAACGVHQAKMPVYMLRAALGLPRDAPVAPLGVRLTDDERVGGMARLDVLMGPRAGDSPRIGLFAEATGAKRYSLAFWQALIDALRGRVPRARLAEIIPAHGRALLPLPGLHTPALREAAALCAGFDAVIAADSGLMHLAAASGVPLLGLFQATDPARYGPYGPRQHALETRGLDAGAIAARAVRDVLAPAEIGGVASG